MPSGLTRRRHRATLEARIRARAPATAVARRRAIRANGRARQGMRRVQGRRENDRVRAPADPRSPRPRAVAAPARAAGTPSGPIPLLRPEASRRWPPGSSRARCRVRQRARHSPRCRPTRRRPRRAAPRRARGSAPGDGDWQRPHRARPRSLPESCPVARAPRPDGTGHRRLLDAPAAPAESRASRRSGDLPTGSRGRGRTIACIRARPSGQAPLHGVADRGRRHSHQCAADECAPKAE